MDATTPVAGRIGFVSLDTPDVAAAVDFYRNVGRLSVTDQTTSEVFLTGGVQHHWVHLRQGPAGPFRVGYEVVDPDQLDAVADRLSDRGLKFRRADVTDEGLYDSLLFSDPDGVEVELFGSMTELPVKPTQPTVRMTKLLHAVWSTTTTTAGAEFYSSVLGFRPSDWIEQKVVFMRCSDGYHHSAGLIAGGASGAGKLHHFCVLVESLDDVMRARANALARGAEMRQDVLRHAASGSIGIYVADPFSGASMEFCTGHLRVTDESTYRARRLMGGPVTSDLWQEGALRDEP
jgi:catechol 2,3-dioxygenase-like lactoylglutathione lyase family enzyme